jgi:hypothetical protein
MTRAMTRGVAARITGAVLVFSGASAAQTSDTALAQSLFEKGRELMASRRYGEACPMLAESQRLDPGGGTLLNLAVCHEAEGKLTTAWSEFNLAVSLARKDGRKDREDLARARVEALEPRLNHVVVSVPDESLVQGLVVSLDGTALSSVAWGVPAAVDPGEHHVVAEAPGYASWTWRVVVEGEGKTRTVTVPALEVGKPAFWSSSGMPHYAPYHPKVGSKSAARYTVGALALASVGVSIGTGIAALVLHGSANNQCDTSRGYCSSQTGIDEQDSARTWAWVSTVTLGAGIVGAGVWLFWPKVPADTKAAFVPSPSGGTLVFRGAF